MNKRLIFSLLATLPTVSFANGSNVSGFADITYTNDNDMSIYREVSRRHSIKALPLRVLDGGIFTSLNADCE